MNEKEKLDKGKTAKLDKNIYEYKCNDAYGISGRF